MATKSLGHLSVATGTTGSSTTACNFTAINGLGAVDFDDFNGTINGLNGLSHDTIYIETEGDVYCNWFSYGTRFLAKIATVDANFAFSEDSGERVLSEVSQSGDAMTYTGVDTGTAIVTCDYDDGYNTSASPTESVTVGEPD